MEDDTDKNDYIVNLILDNLYDVIFGSLASSEPCLRESSSFLLSNFCILSSDRAFKLVEKSDMISRLIDSIMVGLDTITIKYLCRAYTNLLKSLQMSDLV